VFRRTKRSLSRKQAITARIAQWKEQMPDTNGPKH
jgi:hypothetical protein